MIARRLQQKDEACQKPASKWQTTSRRSIIVTYQNYTVIVNARRSRVIKALQQWTIRYNSIAYLQDLVVERVLEILIHVRFSCV